jgi:uncharacterized iron-regulated membrane protein
MSVNFGAMFLWLFAYYLGLAILAVIAIFGWILWKQRKKEFDGSFGEPKRKDELEKS